MNLPEPGTYKTAAGSEVKISGEYGGVSRVTFDWCEEPDACVDCEPEPYPENFGSAKWITVPGPDGRPAPQYCVSGEWRLVWNCEECGGGSAVLTRVEEPE